MQQELLPAARGRSLVFPCFSDPSDLYAVLFCGDRDLSVFVS